MIISTGTGSTGWLFSAKRFTETEVQNTLEGLGFCEPVEAIKLMADQLSENTKFSPSLPQLFYYIREPILQQDFEAHWQGFGTNVEFLSELLDGRVSIDGLSSVDVGLGDSFTVRCDKNQALKTIKFIL
jgi:hypothetical protein